MALPNYTVTQLQEIFPELEIRRQVGNGAFKVVFEAMRGEYRFALKVLGDNIDFTRLRREVSAMRLLESPYIAKLERFEIRDTPSLSIAYLLEDFIEGNELKKIVDNGKIYTPHEILTFLDKVLQGLETCWAKRIVHRDIKPANIMIRDNGDPVLVDFGLSRHLDQTSLTPTENPFIIGTPLFAPPEVLKYKKDEIDSKTDLYSLGVTSYMMVTGIHPYVPSLQGVSSEEAFQRLLSSPAQAAHELNSGIPVPLSKFIMRLINRNRVDRPKDASHARQLLNSTAIQLGVAL